jgi:hypothetical protein
MGLASLPLSTPDCTQDMLLLQLHADELINKA